MQFLFLMLAFSLPLFGQPSRQAAFGAKIWPGGRIPFEISVNLRLRDCLSLAIREWNTRTPVRLSPRAGEADYVVFTPAPRSAAAIGLIGGPQPVFLDESGVCEQGAYRTMVHEIGHAVGLYHEHQRSDRDRFIRVQQEFSSLPPQELVTTVGAPLGPYDYASVMHYGPLGGAASPAIDTLPRGIPTSLDLGIEPMLSPGDLDAVQRMYGEAPRLTTISTNPPGLDVMVDGQRRTAPFTVEWPAGSQHTVDVITPQTRPGARYEFARWNDEGRQSHVVTAGTLTHWSANFAAYVQIRGVSNDPERGSVVVDSPDGSASPADGLRLLGSTVRLRAIPAPGYFLKTWEAGRGSRNPLLFPVFHADPVFNDFVARFDPYPTTTINSQPVGVRPTVNGAVATTPAQFRWEPGVVQSIDFPREVVLPGARHKLTLIRTEAPIQSPGKVIATPYDANIVAIYSTEYPVRASASPAEGGRVMMQPGLAEGYVLPGDVLQFRAEPAAGFQFARWRGTVTSTSAQISVEAQSAIELVAEFVSINNASVTVRNAASALGGPVSPGAIISLFLPGLPELAFGAFTDGRLATEVAGVKVLANGIAAPIIAVAPGQVNAIVPYGVEGPSVRFMVMRDGNMLAEAAAQVGDATPALFTANSSGSGPAAALNQDGQVNSAARPAKAGEIVVLFGTGEGPLDRAVGDGSIAAAPLAKPKLPVSVEIGGREARVLYAGPAPGSVHGLLQINAEVPAGIAPGTASAVVRAGANRSAPGVSIAVE